MVEAKPALCWSPGQIAGWLRRQFPGDSAVQISHQAIYLSLHDLRRRQTIDRGLTQRLRSARPMRRPRIARRTWRGVIRGMVSDALDARFGALAQGRASVLPSFVPRDPLTSP
ncbi:hypothetical protein [Streptomyces poonensis]|uniref:Uncharacterized protein n=1 Tax=Streptomyces poonensis TaxID=68255 RepID=A0A918Q644_9ACTN|nr:hypothetical protein [Streptomyces poonensis]GGZ32041.1 hypothetical protein GCM10010365_60920 [Streptomyces poonensis]GLJ93398.1 hypothetical protein GCM10017589_60100 [Streptomyces poonensis]